MMFPRSGFSQQAVVGKNDLPELPEMHALKINGAPVIDGHVHVDTVWQDVPMINDLTQTQPEAGMPASEITEIRVAYNHEFLFVSAICYDQSPHTLVVSDARRDASLDNTDAFLMIFDTYHDGQNGFVFGTNPLAVQYDGQVDNEGQGNFNSNRQQGGNIGGFNLNWDASWKVATHVGDHGWTAEFAIPLSTLRYRNGSDQVWGLNFRRNIRKNNEISYWAQIPINFNLYRLSLAGDLRGLDIKRPKNLQFTPYVLGQTQRDYLDPDDRFDLRTDVGADIKYSLTPSLTLDLTYNTDFAQVEVDEQQVNLDRFNLFFPEKRPFFLENAGQFSVGSPGEVDLFFSRRIGIGEGGSLVPILGGARMSGKVGSTNVGLLSMFTDGVHEEDVERTNYNVARVNHEFGGRRSAIGGLFVHKSALVDNSPDHSTMAIDAKLGIGQKARITGYLAKTNTPGINKGDHSFKLRSDYEWNGWSIRTAYTEVGEGFNPEVGFLQRSTFRKPEFRVLYQWRMHGKFGLLELRPHVSYYSFWNFSGVQETKYLHIDNHWEWISGLEIHTGVNLTAETVLQTFQIFEDVIVHTGTYQHSEAQLVFRTNESKQVSISTRHILGGFFGGERYANSVSLKFRLGDKFNSDFSLRRNDISLPEGTFATNLISTRLAYAFKPNVYLQSLVQYNSVQEIWLANMRLGWLQKANAGLFIVYNEVRGESRIDSRSLTIKYSHLIDVL
ncbi:MAG: carbohydrate binding family 9 domain-containing protein [Saprospiraceae bacterium]|nr:carbohydrate binding family 9 domain-containing protein [Saprospiraceae bacterium]